MDALSADRWRAVARLARGQHGLVTTAGLRSCGIGKGSIEKGVRAGRLHRVHVGVYAVGHDGLTREADWLAAVLACGAGAVLSHRCAATALRMREAVGPRVDVTTPGGSGRGRPGIELHRARLEPIEMRVHHRIPITSPARTMVDLAHALDDPDDVHWTVRQMQYRKLFDRLELELANRRRPSRVLSEILRDLAPTGSPLEVSFLRKVIRRYGLPMPLCQAGIEGFHVDFLWPSARLVVEVDGNNHDQPAMCQADAARDNILHLAGYLVPRFRAPDVHRLHARTATQVRAALRMRGS